MGPWASSLDGRLASSGYCKPHRSRPSRPTLSPRLSRPVIAPSVLHIASRHVAPKALAVGSPRDSAPCQINGRTHRQHQPWHQPQCVVCIERIFQPRRALCLRISCVFVYIGPSLIDEVNPAWSVLRQSQEVQGGRSSCKRKTQKNIQTQNAIPGQDKEMAPLESTQSR